MSERTTKRVPIKPGFFTIPDDPADAPRFLGTRCAVCGECFYPRRAICGKCLSEEMQPFEMEARGELYSYTFVHLPLFGSTNLEHSEGYGVGQIDLPEGPRIQAPLAGKQEDFRVGQPVLGELDKLRDNKNGEEVMIVRFRPVQVVA
jgi:uncharacterized OB-fold protein